MLLLKNGLIVRSQLFSVHQSIGSPMHTVRRLSNWNVDELILLDIYPAREEPIPGITSGVIFDRITSKEKVLLKKAELLDFLENKELDVLVTLGAGDIEHLLPAIKQLLEKKSIGK